MIVVSLIVRPTGLFAAPAQAVLSRKFPDRKGR